MMEPSQLNAHKTRSHRKMSRRYSDMQQNTFFFFFFQAEDGIRDFHVTGVQTCALPISWGLEGLASVVAVQGELAWATHLWGTAEALREAIGAPLQPIERADYEQAVATARDHLGVETFRSEERRVGKEGRSRWWAVSG